MLNEKNKIKKLSHDECESKRLSRGEIQFAKGKYAIFYFLF